jgi:hypothetical protein
MKRLLILLGAAITSIMLSACGEGTVDAGDANYEPKIVISGYIFANTNVERISVMRNIPLNTNVDYNSVVLKNADVKIYDVEANTAYKLDYDEATLTFKYNGGGLKIKSGKSYRIEVEAVVDGKNLKASSVTTVPLNGFKILHKDLGTLPYREKDNAGQVKKVNFDFTPSASANYYGVSIVALDNDFSRFIKDNAYFKVDDTADVIKNIDNYIYRQDMIPNVNPLAGHINVQIEWHNIWFYGRYRVIVYAGDQNFRNFSTVNQNLMEMDGNFHTPIVDIQGDGIGVFASAIADTLTFSVK